MKITRIDLFEYDLPLLKPFVTSQRTLGNRRGLIVRGVSENRLIGYGEIAPLAGFSRESLADCISATKGSVRRLESSNIPNSPEDLAAGLDAMVDAPPAVIFGLELMLADLASQIAGKQLALWLQPRASRDVAINAVLAGGEIATQVQAKITSGYQTLKLKIGAASLVEDLEQIAMVRNLAGSGIKLRLDANRAYDYDQAVRLFAKIREFDIEYVEEPLSTPSLNALQRLRNESSIPVAIDETLIDWCFASDVNGISLSQIQLAAFDVAVCKPALMGSILRTLKFADEIAGQGKHVVVTSSLDTGIGVSAALSIACALRVNSACGLDTTEIFLEQPIDFMPNVTAGRLTLPSGVGLGFGWDLDCVAADILRKINVD